MNTREPGLSNIDIGTARWLCNKNLLDGVIIIAFGKGACKSVSYGAKVQQCRQLGKLIDRFGVVIESGEVPLDTFERMPLFQD